MPSNCAADKIVTGSFSGALRVFRPSSPETRDNAGASDGGAGSSCLPADVLLDTRLGAPVLQLAVGCFLPASPLLALAVLHPHKLAVYTVVTTSSGGYGTDSSISSNLGSFAKLQKQFEHVFVGSATAGRNSFTAANMCTGQFGSTSSISATGALGSGAKRDPSSMFTTASTGISGSDAVQNEHIAVQSMDGQVAIFEGPTSGPVRQLEGVLLPGPLQYIPKTDTFVTAASDLTIAGYRYSAIVGGGPGSGAMGGAAATPIINASGDSKLGDTPTAAAGAGIAGKGKKEPPARPDWSINIGEAAPFLHIGRYDRHTADTATSSATAAAFGGGSSSMATALPVDIIAIGDRTLYTLRDTVSGGATSTAVGGAAAGSSSAASSSSSMAVANLPPSSPASNAPIRSQKRFEYSPVASCLFPRSGASSSLSLTGQAIAAAAATSSSTSSSDPSASSSASMAHNLMVASHDGTLHVYREDALAWAARLPFVPVAIGVGRFGGSAGSSSAASAAGGAQRYQNGVIVILSARGDVCCCYLGTDPSTGSLVGGEAVRELNYQAMDQEYRKLMAQIREMAANANKSGSGAAGDAGADKLVITPTVPVTIDDAPTRPGCTCSNGAGVVGGQRGVNWWPADDVEFEPESSADDEDEEEEVQQQQHRHGGGGAAAGWIATVSLSLSCPAPQPLSDVRLTISPPSWVRLPVGMRSITIPSVPFQAPPSSSSLSSDADASGAGASTRVLLPLCAGRRGVPTEQSVTVIATYTTTASAAAGDTGRQQTYTSTATFSVPLSLVCCPIPPVKQAPFKLTIDTNRPPTPLTSLFPDMMRLPAHAVGSSDTITRIQASVQSVLSFGYPSGADVTILVSKAGGRYRLQSSHPEAVAPVAAALVDRLGRFYSQQPGAEGPGTIALRTGGTGAASSSDGKEEETEGSADLASRAVDQTPLEYRQSFTASFNEQLPLPELQAAMDSHLAARHTLQSSYSSLNDRAHEYRLVVKRLLVRFKDRTPAPMNQLDALLERAQEHVMDGGAAVATAQNQLAASSNVLSGRVTLFLLLLKLRFGLSEQAFAALQSHVPSQVSDTLEAGWEEATDASLQHLLRAGMRAPSSSTTAAPPPDHSALQPSQLTGAPPDTSKLRKHLLILVDRLSKGWSTA